MIHPNRPSNVYPVRKNHKLELSYFARNFLGLEILFNQTKNQIPSNFDFLVFSKCDFYNLKLDYETGKSQFQIIQELEIKNKLILKINEKLFSHLSIEKLELILKQSHY